MSKLALAATVHCLSGCAIGTALFWGSLAAALLLAGAAAFPVNRWLISRGKGHAVVHSHHRS